MLTQPRRTSAPCAYRNGPRHRRPTERPTFEVEEAYWRSGRASVAGVDEAGRGALAGPVVAAACVLPLDVQIEDLRDSKTLTERRREHLFDEILDRCLAYGICTVGADVIDRENILRATLSAMTGAVMDLECRREDIALDAVLVDGNVAPNGLRHEIQTIIRGDARSLTIAAASILAKVTRDRLMRQYHAAYPDYGFDRHKGYGTAAHISAIQQFGPCPLHRMTFKPLSDFERSSSTPRSIQENS